MSATELRFAEFRYDSESRTLSGTLIRFDDRAQIGGSFKERITPGAFGDLGSADVVLNVQHDRGRPIARTGGGGLSLTEDGNGVKVKATLPETREADDVIALVKSRVLRGLSAEMIVREDRWSGGGKEREILAANLTGLAVVDRPAYPQSSVDLRNARAQLASSRGVLSVYGLVK